jgi:hypothetical protein
MRASLGRLARLSAPRGLMSGVSRRVMHRPDIIMKIGLVTIFVGVSEFNDIKALCMEDEIDATMRELLGTSPPVEDDEEEEDDDDGEEEADDLSPDFDVDDARYEEATPAPGLVLGGRAVHEFLKEGTIIAFFDTGEAVKDSGIVATHFDVEAHPQRVNKVCFEFLQEVKIGRKKRLEKTRRWVSADSLEPVIEGAEPRATSPVATTPAAGTFVMMAVAAIAPAAFTAGMTPPELAKHERERKRSRLKDAPVRGHNKAGRKTKEPSVPLEQRIADYPNETLRIEKGALFCAACNKPRSARLTALVTHVLWPREPYTFERLATTLPPLTCYTLFLATVVCKQGASRKRRKVPPSNHGR